MVEKNSFLGKMMDKKASGKKPDAKVRAEDATNSFYDSNEYSQIRYRLIEQRAHLVRMADYSEDAAIKLNDIYELMQDQNKNQTQAKSADDVSPLSALDTFFKNSRYKGSKYIPVKILNDLQGGGGAGGEFDIDIDRKRRRSRRGRGIAGAIAGILGIIGLGVAAGSMYGSEEEPETAPEANPVPVPVAPPVTQPAIPPVIEAPDVVPGITPDTLPDLPSASATPGATPAPDLPPLSLPDMPPATSAAPAAPPAMTAPAAPDLTPPAVTDIAPSVPSGEVTPRTETTAPTPLTPPVTDYRPAPDTTVPAAPTTETGSSNPLSDIPVPSSETAAQVSIIAILSSILLTLQQRAAGAAPVGVGGIGRRGGFGGGGRIPMMPDRLNPFNVSAQVGDQSAPIKRLLLEADEITFEANKFDFIQKSLFGTPQTEELTNASYSDQPTTGGGGSAGGGGGGAGTSGGESETSASGGGVGVGASSVPPGASGGYSGGGAGGGGSTGGGGGYSSGATGGGASSGGGYGGGASDSGAAGSVMGDTAVTPGMSGGGGVGGTTAGAPGQVVEIQETGAGYNVVKLADGTVEKRTGDRNWRNNNPGNIEYGDFTRSHGAIGSDGRFAIFPTFEMGEKAQEALLFEGKNYRDKTIAQAISRYAPASDDNNVSMYVNTVSNAVGVSPDTPLAELTPEQRKVMLSAMHRVEGLRPGKTEILVAGSGTTSPASTAPGATPTETASSSSGAGATPAQPAGMLDVSGYVADLSKDVTLGLETPQKPTASPAVTINTNVNNTSSPAYQRVDEPYEAVDMDDMIKKLFDDVIFA